MAPYFTYQSFSFGDHLPPADFTCCRRARLDAAIRRGTRVSDENPRDDGFQSVTSTISSTVFNRFWFASSYLYRMQTRESPYFCVNCVVPFCPGLSTSRVFVLLTSASCERLTWRNYIICISFFMNKSVILFCFQTKMLKMGPIWKPVWQYLRVLTHYFVGIGSSLRQQTAGRSH